MKDLLQQNGALALVNSWVLGWWMQQPVVHSFVERTLSEDLLNCSGTSVTHSAVTGSKATQGLENTGGEVLWMSLRKNGKWSETSASPTGELSLEEEGRAHPVGRRAGGPDQRHRPASGGARKAWSRIKSELDLQAIKVPPTQTTWPASWET